jgi:hypothetical protein
MGEPCGTNKTGKALGLEEEGVVCMGATVKSPSAKKKWLIKTSLLQNKQQ